jgi:hypothetical protein
MRTTHEAVRELYKDLYTTHRDLPVLKNRPPAK